MAMFNAIGAGVKNWRGVTVAPNHDVYAAEYNGDIWFQAGGVGPFVALGEPVRLWWGITADTNGDIYALVNNDGYYKRTGGVGAFNLLRAYPQPTTDMKINPANGLLYFAVGFGGDIYQAPKGGAAPTAQGWGVAPYYCFTGVQNGDQYAGLTGGAGLIYQRVGGVAPTIDSGAPAASWYGLTYSSYGDVWGCQQNGDIYRRAGGVGAWQAVGDPVRIWAGMGYGDGWIYATVANGDIYRALDPNIKNRRRHKGGELWGIIPEIANYLG